MSQRLGIFPRPATEMKNRTKYGPHLNWPLKVESCQTGSSSFLPVVQHFIHGFIKSYSIKLGTFLSIKRMRALVPTSRFWILQMRCKIHKCICQTKMICRKIFRAFNDFPWSCHIIWWYFLTLHSKTNAKKKKYLYYFYVILHEFHGWLLKSVSVRLLLGDWICPARLPRRPGISSAANTGRYLHD